MSFFSSKNEELSLIFDINSRSVGAALATLRADGSPAFSRTGRVHIAFRDKPTASEMMSHTVSALTKICMELQKEAHRVKNVHIIFSAPWYVSQIKVAKIEKKEKFVFTERLLDEMIAHEKMAVNSVASTEKEAKSKDSLELLEQKIIHTKLNGYETSNPFNREAVSAEVSIYMSFIPSKFVEKIKETILHFFHARHFDLHSFSVAAYSVIRLLYPDQNDFLLVDINGEMTEISIVKSGALLETVSFPLGHHHLVRKMTGTKESPKELAVSFLNLHLEKKLDKKTRDTTEKFLEKDKAEWISSFQSTLGSLGSTRGIPKTAFIVSEKVFAPFFATSIEKELGGEGVAKVTAIDTNSFLRHFSENHETKADISLFLEGIFLNTLFANRS